MDPADAEADAGWAQPVGERQHDRLAAARDHDPVHLGAVDELLEDRLPGRGRGERLVQVRLDVVERLDAEDAALTARVGRLEHGREADLLDGAMALRPACAARRSAAAARPPRRAGAASRPCASSGARSRRRSRAARAPSATAATTGTARSAETVSTPSSSTSATASSTASGSEKSTTFAMSASPRPSASGLRSTAATRSPSSFARRIARRWWRPGADEENGLQGPRDAR